MKKVAVIGHFGFGKDLLNGQTIKTKILTEALKKRMGEENISCVDTHGGIKKLIELVFKLPGVLKSNDEVIMLPAHNGLLIFTPVLSFFNMFAGKNLHYVVIGGWLPGYLDKHKCTAMLLRKYYKGIYVETNGMMEQLEEKGFKNILVMPNCKKLHIVDEIKTEDAPPYRFCTFSRVMREKGIEDAINVITEINRKSGKELCALDIYGQIDAQYEDAFSKLRENFPAYIKYKGSVEFSKSTQVLKEYYAMLFPTYYAGEGFAGTVIDAFAAGIPVIASDWKYNAEVVEHMRTGLVYEQGKGEEFEKAIMLLLEDKDLSKRIRENCVAEAEKYLPESVVEVLLGNLEK